MTSLGFLTIYKNLLLEEELVGKIFVLQISPKMFLNDLQSGTPERGAQGGPRPSCPFSRGAGGAKVPFYKIFLFKNEQASAEVIICAKAESGVIARTEILRSY